MPGRYASSYSAGSNYKVTWTCLKADCGHSFDATVKDVFGRESDCPFCTPGTGRFCETACAACRKRSFAAWLESTDSRLGWSASNETTVNPERISLSSRPPQMLLGGMARVDGLQIQMESVEY